MPRKKRRVQNWTPIDEVPAPPPVVIKPAEVKKTQLRVAAYCRVSTDRLEQESSIESQTSYYSSLIKSNISWTFAGIYKDVLSGTKSDRPGLQAMLEDCRGGKIDRILCKSISRLARDTLTTLQIVMELRNLGISIYFEKEDIDTSTYSSEILLSCYSAFAEMESQSIGENNKWAIRKRFEAGTYRIANLTYGYRYDSASVHDEHNFSTDVHNATTAREEKSTDEKSTDEKSTDEKKIIIDPTQASVVRRIFLCALEGVSTYKIASMLNEEGIPGPRGKEWVKRNILMILHNEFYNLNFVFFLTRHVRSE